MLGHGLHRQANIAALGLFQDQSHENHTPIFGKGLNIAGEEGTEPHIWRDPYVCIVGSGHLVDQDGRRLSS
jgi:hypothetical protein